MMSLSLASWSNRYHLHLIDASNVELARDYFVRLQEDGLVSQSFPDESIQTPEDFVQLALSPANILYINTCNDVMASHVNLNQFNGRVAYIHFSILREYHGALAIEMGLSVVHRLFHQLRLDETPLVKALIGVTPVSNPLAIRYNRAIGFKKLAVLPDAFELKHSFVDAVLTVRYPDG